MRKRTSKGHGKHHRHHRRERARNIVIGTASFSLAKGAALRETLDSLLSF